MARQGKKDQAPEKDKEAGKGKSKGQEKGKSKSQKVKQPKEPVTFRGKPVPGGMITALSLCLLLALLVRGSLFAVPAGIAMLGLLAVGIALLVASVMTNDGSDLEKELASRSQAHKDALVAAAAFAVIQAGSSCIEVINKANKLGSAWAGPAGHELRGIIQDQIAHGQPKELQKAAGLGHPGFAIVASTWKQVNQTMSALAVAQSASEVTGIVKGPAVKLRASLDDKKLTDLLPKKDKSAAKSAGKGAGKN